MKAKQSCYLDANFLIAFFSCNHEDEKASRKKMFELLTQYNSLNISCLALDETMHKVCTISNEKNVPGQRRKTHKDWFPLYKRMLNYILKNPAMNIVQFENNIEVGVCNAIDNIKNHDLAPHDAFHYAMMKDLGINFIVTKDDDFSSIKDITVISY